MQITLRPKDPLIVKSKNFYRSSQTILQINLLLNQQVRAITKNLLKITDIKELRGRPLNDLRLHNMIKKDRELQHL